MNLKDLEDRLSLDNFIETMDEQYLTEWETMYKGYLNTTTTDINTQTGKNYTKEEIEDLYKMCNTNLDKINKRKKINKII